VKKTLLIIANVLLGVVVAGVVWDVVATVFSVSGYGLPESTIEIPLWAMLAIGAVATGGIAVVSLALRRSEPNTQQLVRQIADELIGVLQEKRKYEGAAEEPERVREPAVESRIAALRDEDKEVREAAAEALGMIRDTRAVDVLIPALGDEDWDVRQRAAYALGQIGDPRAAAPLRAALLRVAREREKLRGKL
jgi:predicted phosphoribosyltransferase